ncbi:MAG: hypothetical protein A3K19_03740 [Lentisphaerae bacterium RIFOXYB12_FULL_65_16]|nr:MAG: hypothetical protein A3K18_03125 [Lentisphaerae bacterium RIFOXYA12_64_32]OGV89256.1 MAG: hypothetical protein A3K19_03740 [Lentisphaerae bacterium RIFOXYB12_FULL_65_16]
MDRELQARIAQAAADVFAGTPVFLAYAYGSRCTGGARPDSDLDVGYYVGASSPSQALPIKEEMVLASRLSTRVGLDVDLRHLGDAPLELRGRALEDGVRIYCSDHVARVNLERDLLSAYHDYKFEIMRFHDLRLARFALRGA